MTNVFLFGAAEAAHGENYYVSWANLAPREWSAGVGVNVNPASPSNRTQSHRPNLSLTAPKHTQSKENSSLDDSDIILS